MKNNYRSPSGKNNSVYTGLADLSRDKLRERVKELSCLYGIAKIASSPFLSVESKLEHIILLLPPAWQYPASACARIAIDRQIFKTPGFREGKHRQSCAINIGGTDRGTVEIHYRDEGISSSGGNPFLKEEQSLLDTIAGQIALMVERKETEDATYELQKQLMRADRLAAIGQLSAGVAHELNEPLNTILGFAQLTKKDPGLSDQALKDIHKIEEAAIRARTIIRELLTFGRQVKGGGTPVNLNQVISDELSLFKTLCRNGSVELRLITDYDLPEIMADRSQITQVISNLIVNALQAMPAGGLLTIQTSFDDASVSVMVEDTGIGMNDEVKEKMFLPFFTTKDVDQGTGLGLSVVHGIVSSHRGEIAVESEELKGTRIVVTLPRNELSLEEE